MTGSVRDNNRAKPALAQIPWESLDEIGMRFRQGELQYGKNNWRKGQPLTEICDSLMRHLSAFMQGKADDDHRAAIGWNAVVLMWTHMQTQNGTLPAELDDRDVRKRPRDIPHAVQEEMAREWDEWQREQDEKLEARVLE